MCCLFGLIDTQQRYSGAEKARMLHALATAAEARGTDAAGYACNGSGGLIVRKSPVPGHKLRFTVSDDTVTVMGHTRMTTQGDARRNRNNHPFLGSINGARFAFAHNGVIYNDHELRERFKLPYTKIETDSYIAVQLLETQEALGFDALRFAAEQLEGSFTFTALGEQNDLYIVKGDNPLNLIRFPKTGLFLYASTREILEKALESCSQRANNGVWERMESGEMLKIDGAGVVTRSRFDDSKLLGWYAPYSYACTPRYRSDGSYVGELKAVAYAFGYTPAMIDRLISRGFQPEEIEDFNMSANVETMMYVREKPWHGLGTLVPEAPTSADALRFAGLDWSVRQEPVYNARGGVISGYKSNVRDTDGSVLGIVGDRYKVVQNIDAFNFTDDLIGGDVRYETAGSLREGKQIWLLAKMPARRVASDDVEPYLCFTNSHDGSGGLKVCMTPIRVVCNNTLNLALGSAKRIWSMRHTENIRERMQEARDCLALADEYMSGLARYADRAANKTLYDRDVKAILEELFPITDKSTEREKATAEKCRNEFMVCYYAPDIKRFRGTAWGVINAASDLATHSMPHRNTKNYAENNWSRVMDGHAIIDKAVKLCGVAA